MAAAAAAAGVGELVAAVHNGSECLFEVHMPATGRPERSDNDGAMRCSLRQLVLGCMPACITLSCCLCPLHPQSERMGMPPPHAAQPSDNIRELKKQLGEYMTSFMKQQNMDTEEGEQLHWVGRAPASGCTARRAVTALCPCCLLSRWPVAPPGGCSGPDGGGGVGWRRGGGRQAGSGREEGAGRQEAQAAGVAPGVTQRRRHLPH